MSPKLSVGIVLPANNLGGPQKVTAIAALDLASNGHQVTIFLPVLPYHYYLVSLGKRPLPWLKMCLPYVKDWARSRRFRFDEMLRDQDASRRISVKFVPRRASKRALKGLDCLIVHGIAQVVEYRDRFPQDAQIFLLHHPDEHSHGHEDTFRAIRSHFKGKTLVVSPFTARQIADHVVDPSILPDPISPLIWDQRHAFDSDGPRRDVLLFWKDHQDGSAGGEIIRALLGMRPETTLSIWCRGRGNRAAAQEMFPNVDIVENVTEQELCELYLGHSLLLFPSTYEGFGMPPIEGLACGCIPVLRPDVGAAELYARDGENSIYLLENVVDLARRMAAALDNTEKLQSLRASGRESIDEFNPDGYGRRILAAAGQL